MTVVTADNGEGRDADMVTMTLAGMGIELVGMTVGTSHCSENFRCISLV